jgi:hypothetical protein
LAGVACFAAAPAFAELVPEREGAQFLQDFADCAVAKGNHAAAEFLATQPASDGELAQAKTLVRSKRSCSRHNVSNSHATFVRGAIAEALYRQRFAVAPASGTVPDIMVADQTSPFFQRLTTMYKLAACVVSRNSMAADALIRSKRGSDAEVAGVSMVQPLVKECRAAIGAGPADLDQLRWVLAEALYRLATAQAAIPTQSLPVVAQD